MDPSRLGRGSPYGSSYGYSSSAPASTYHRDYHRPRPANQPGPLNALPPSHASGHGGSLRLAQLPGSASIPPELQQHSQHAFMHQPAGLPPPTGPNPHTAPYGQGLMQYPADRHAIQAAHQQLQSNGYQFAGYHGTNQASMESIYHRGLDASRTGSASGTEKGSGFYASHQPGYAEDWSDMATQTGEDPKPPYYEAPRYQGSRGQPAVGRVYVQGMDTMQPGRDLAWGVQPSAGDPNHDKALRAHHSSSPPHAELEVVIAPHAYHNVAVIPSGGSEWDQAHLRGSRANWPSHEAPPDYGRR
ncbi:hypothetical protein OOT46_27790 [Aquabacterium sp. A7-Y]|uniref:hypothetical protein n=1 Tax=Aquabacterium sp. A7-Y TaxID=1349605 RepID=UPI00223DB621|nr:hypothetical protein [Aquabacterium sp. A7-Y]MCW7541610.1 hypothetical protein [Aquabacterium sp. A7-Y]